MGHYGPEARRLAEDACRALEPISRNALAARLSALQLAMTRGWSEDKATAWLAETARLLSDLPADIALDAIDEAVKSSASGQKGFMPSVGEIRAIADPRLAERQRMTKRLIAVADLQDGREPDEAVPSAEYCDPAEAARIIDEFKLRRTDEPQVVRVHHDTAPRVPTDADYAALMGITLDELNRRREITRAELEAAEARHADEIEAAADKTARELAA